jgi:hypothetical protein
MVVLRRGCMQLLWQVQRFWADHVGAAALQPPIWGPAQGMAHLVGDAVVCVVCEQGVWGSA